MSVSLPRIVYAPEYEIDIGEHVFPTIKYRLIRDRLLAEGLVDEDDFARPAPATWEQVGLAHSEAYIEKIRADRLSYSEKMTLEVPFTEELVDASLLSCGGTTLTCRMALELGRAVHLGGGFHHAFAGHGEGFCLLNDIAVAALTLLEEGVVARPAVVDLDVHHGNGTAAIFADEPAVFTFSMHQERNYPAVKPAGDLDDALPDRIGDAEYLSRLEAGLDTVFRQHEPDLVVYLAGADPFRDDQLGGLSLSKLGLARRDRMVLERCRDLGIPVAVTLAGGYAFRQVDTVDIHMETVKAVLEDQ